MSERLICRDCEQDLTPTPENGEGWFFHAMGGHRVDVVDSDDRGQECGYAREQDAVMKCEDEKTGSGRASATVPAAIASNVTAPSSAPSCAAPSNCASPANSAATCAGSSSAAPAPASSPCVAPRPSSTNSRAKTITPSQLRALQTLYHRHAARTLGFDAGDRALRLKYFSNFCGRPVASTRDLTRDEANHLIDAFKKSLGQRIAPRPRSRELARALGTEGRRENRDNGVTLAGLRELAIVREYRERLLWSEAEFITWLRGPSGPLRGRSDIRTVGDARRVQWALKGMLKAKGLWR